MEIDELDELFDEADRALVLRKFNAILDVIAKAEEERLRRAGVLTDSDYHDHVALYGHRLSMGCCARAAAEGRPSILDDPQWSSPRTSTKPAEAS